MDTSKPSSDPRVADLVQAGRLQAALFLPQYRRDPASGELRGVWVEVVRALGAHIGIEVVVVELSTPAEMVERLAAGGCDLGSLGFDPARAAQVGGFTPPFMRVDYTFMVGAVSPIRSSSDVDRPGMRIAAVRDHASTLALERVLRHATTIEADVPDQAFEMLHDGKVDGWASIRPTLMVYSSRLPDARILDGSYGANWPALVVARGQNGRLSYLNEFINHAIATGIVQRAIDRADQPGYHVA